MSIERASAFFLHLDSEPALQGLVEDAESVNAVVQIGAEAGFAFSAPELFRAARQLSSQELSEEELKAVAGGVQGPQTVWSKDPVSWLSQKQGWNEAAG